MGIGGKLRTPIILIRKPGMALITDYEFGRMTVDGQVYTSDLLILPDGRVLADWIRKSGHLLTRTDLETALVEKPDLIIAGTGAYGRMVLAPGLFQQLGQMGIQLSAFETAKAVNLFNEAGAASCQRICGCFHLTC